jgi:hypothetical protein
LEKECDEKKSSAQTTFPRGSLLGEFLPPRR